MSLILAAACLAAPFEWSGYWYEQIQRATLVATGEVVEIRPHGEGNRAAVLRVEHILKGDCRDKELVLPFKKTLTFACDYELGYRKAKYLLLIDDLHPFRLVWFPDYPQIEIADYDAPEVRFTRAVLDPEKRILDLEPILKIRRSSNPLEVMAFVSTLPRRTVRPLLPALRRELGPGLKDALARAKPEECFKGVDEAFMSTFDLSLLEGILGRREPLSDPFYLMTPRRKDREEPIQILSRIVGRPYSSLEELQSAWPVALRRSRAEGRPEEVPALIRPLGSDSAAERAAAVTAILDLGPGVLEAVREHRKSEDPEVRARVAAILSELEFLEDVRSEK